MIGYIRNMIRNSAVDGPGNRFVVFLQGCQLNCLYCHNPETIENIESMDAVSRLEVHSYTVEALVSQILPYRDYISGVTFSGGECTLQYEFLLEVCKVLRSEAISVLIDTNGLISPERLRQLSQYVDGFMLDLKALDGKVHKALTGVDNRQILENFKLLNQINKLFEIRTVIIPDFVDDRALIQWISQNDGLDLRYKLIAFRKHGIKGDGMHLKTPSPSYMKEIENFAIQNGFTNIVLI